MKKDKLFIFKSTYWLIVILLVYSCAQVVSPGGGPKDTKPPRAIKYIPDSAAVNFKASKINIYFDEYIQLKDISQLVVSPPLNKPPTIKASYKVLNIEFETLLRDSTTYSINFGNAIADITESNVAENFQYIFSTGTFIDSLSVSGKVQYASDHKTEKGVLVMLYSQMDDSIPCKEKPNYFAKTTDDGSFKINNIKSGTYKVFALKDVNANFLFDSPEESIGFNKETLSIQKDTSTSLSLFTELPKRQFLRLANAIEYGHLLFIFNKPVENFRLTPLNFAAKKEWYKEQYGVNKDTVHCWLMGVNELDTLKLQVNDNEKILDTVEVKIPSKELKSGRGNKFELITKTNIGGGPFNLDNDIVLSFSHPINGKYDESKITLLEDSLPFNLFQTIMKDSINRKMILRKKSKSNIAVKPVKELWKENTSYQLSIPPGTFTDIFGLPSDSVKISFKTQESKHYGTLKLKLSVPDSTKQYIFQLLLGDKGEVARETLINGERGINYENILPGTYRLKLICDENKNGKWDTGDYFKKIQPEQTFYFSSTLEIRSNWDLEQEWKVE